jgi:hypothetical protein
MKNLKTTFSIPPFWWGAFLWGIILPSMAAEKEKSYAPVMRALSAAPSFSHESELEALFEAWENPLSRPASPQARVSSDLEAHIRSKLAELYRHNMELISQFEPYPDKTPHMDPEEWAEAQIQEWKNYPAHHETIEEDLDEGIGGTPKTRSKYFLEQAKEALIDLIKENDLLTQEVARRHLI